MNTLHVSSYSAVVWRQGHLGSTELVGSVSPTEVTQHASPNPAPVVAAPVALECVNHPEGEIAIWIGGKGWCRQRKPLSSIRHVLFACTDAARSGVFFARHKGRTLDFALVVHQPGDPQRLKDSPTFFTAELTALLADAMPAESGDNAGRTEKRASMFTVRHAVLRQTLQGTVVAALLRICGGDVYAVVGNLEKREWRKWRVVAPFSSYPCIHIVASGGEVRFVCSEVVAPADADTSVVAPSLPLALLSFDRMSSTSIVVAPEASRVCCVVLHELVFPTHDTDGPVVDRCFQSQCFDLADTDMRSTSHRCFVHVDEFTATYTVVVPFQRSSCVVHATSVPNLSGLHTTCAVVPGLQHPVSACTLSLPLPNRPHGARLSLIVSETLQLFCCEQFGQVVRTRLTLEDGDVPAIRLPDVPTSKLLKGKEEKNGTTPLPRLSLVPLHNQTAFVCSNGQAGMFFYVSACVLDDAAPGVADAAENTFSGRLVRDVQSGQAAGAAALQRSLMALQELSLSTTRHDLPDIVFRHVVPHLRYVGSSQQEVMLVQRVFEALLQLASPILEAEWTYLWGLTRVLQKTLAKRGGNNRLYFTDAFFMKLAEMYRQSGFASSAGAALVGEGVLASTSAEARDVITAEPYCIPPEAAYLLDGLAASVSPLALAEEVMRRMVTTEILSSGSCVVAARAGTADGVHCMGSILVASCLDLDVYVSVQGSSGRGIRVSLEKHPGGVSLAIPPTAFENQAQFEKALVAAGDLLSVPSADASFRPDVALLTLSLGARQHCVTAFLQLFAPLFEAALEEVAPLANNRDWLEGTVATLSQGPMERVAALLSAERGDGASLATTVCYLLYASPQQDLNVDLFQSVSRTFPAEFGTLSLVAGLLHRTEELFAAMNNYTSAVATCVVQHRSAWEAGSSWQEVKVGKRRLLAALRRAAILWEHVDALSPYRIHEIAESYRVSAAHSVSEDARLTMRSSTSTMASRALVWCFRLFCLVVYSLHVEDTLDRSVAEDGSRWTMEGRLAADCRCAVEALYVMRDSAFPIDWFEKKFLLLARHAAAATSGWTSYVVRLLQLSTLPHSSNAMSKREYYSVLDTLQRNHQPSPEAEEAKAQRTATTELESTVDALTAQSPHGVLPSAGGMDADRVSAEEPDFFIFSHQGDASLPRWVYPHAAAERGCATSPDWAERLWTLERVPELLRSTCTIAVERVRQSARKAQSTFGDGAGPPALSEELAAPLYAYLCRLNPPVRVHAMGVHLTEDGTKLLRAERREPRKQPDKLQWQGGPDAVESVATQRREASRGEVAVAKVPRTASPLSTAAGGVPSAAVRDAHKNATQIQSNRGKPASSQMAVETPPRVTLYTAKDVAWWEMLDSAHREPDGARTNTLVDSPRRGAAAAEDNGETSDSATTCTTATSTDDAPLAAVDATHRWQHRQHRKRASGSSSDEPSPPCMHPCSRMAHSPRQGDHKKKCHCLRAAAHLYGRERLVSGGNAIEAEEVRLRWPNSMKGRSTSPFRLPRGATASPAAVSARPTLLRFSTRLQPPQEPASFAHTARPVQLGDGEPGPLLALRPSVGGRSMAPLVRLYTVEGERACRADGRDGVGSGLPPLSSSDATYGVPLKAPPLPPSSVFVAPGPLLRLATPPGSRLVPSGAPHVSAEVPQEGAGRPYVQALRAVRGPAPPAVDVAALANPSDIAAQPAPTSTEGSTAAAKETVAAVAPLPAPAPAAAAEPASLPAPVSVPPYLPVSAMLLPTPTVPQVGAGSVLNPSQALQFRQYTEDLLARHNAATAEAVASPQPARAPPVFSHGREGGSAADGTSFAVPVGQPVATGTAPSLAPPAVAGGGGGEAAVTELLRQQQDFICKAEAVLDTRQTENEIFYRRVVESIRGLTATTQQLRGLSPVEQSQLVQNTVKQRNELMSLNHQLLEMQLEAARRGGEIPRSVGTATASHPPALSTGWSPSTPETATNATQTLPPARQSTGVSWAGEAAGPPISTVEMTGTAGLAPARTCPSSKGMHETLSDLQRLNAELMGVNASAEAMGKAIEETREVIQRYERTKKSEVVVAEGVALSAAMRLRTAAIERRLEELPKASSPAVRTGAAASSRVWVSQSLVDDNGAVHAVERQIVETPQEAQQPQKSSASPPPAASASPSSALAEVSAVTGGGVQPLHIAASTPDAVSGAAPYLDATAAYGGHPTRAQEQLPPAAVSSCPPSALLGPPAVTRSGSAMFTSISSTPLVDDVTLPLEANEALAPPSTATSLGHVGEGRLRPHESGSCTATHRCSPAELTTAPSCRATAMSDLGTLFKAAGGRYEVPHASKGAARLKAAGGPPLRRLVGRSPPRISHTGQKWSTSPQPSAAQRSVLAEDRYAMYRAAPMPTKKSTAIADARLAPPPGVVWDASAATPRRVTTHDAFVEKQQSRRMDSIAKRMQLLEQDLFA